MLLQTLRNAGRAYTAHVSATEAVPSPLGKLIYDFSASHGEVSDHPAKRGWHSTNLDRVGEQLGAGRFANKGQDIYVGGQEEAIHFGGQGDQPVILEVESPHATTTHPVLKTRYFPGVPGQDVRILRAFHVNPDYLKAQSELTLGKQIGIRVDGIAKALGIA